MEIITDDDIKYMDNNVCILFPDSLKGIIVWTCQDSINNVDILKGGIKSGLLLSQEGCRYGRRTNHPYIFFRAPDKKYTKLEECPKGDNKIYIRVDPDRTMVFSSELRAKYPPHCLYGTLQYYSRLNEQLVKSRKTLTRFLDIIEENELCNDINKGYIFVYNLITSRRIIQRINHPIEYPYDTLNVKMASEILISIPHLTPDYFIL
jgi:hypothetical protein